MKEETTTARLHPAPPAQAFLDRLASIGRALSHRAQSSSQLEQIFDELLQFHDYSTFWIMAGEPGGTTLSLICQCGIPDGRLPLWQNGITPPCLSTLVFQTGQPIALKDLQRCDMYSRHCALHDTAIQAHLFIPVTRGGLVIGVLGTGTRHRRKFQPEEVHFFAVLSAMLTPLLEEQWLRRPKNRLARILDGAILPELIGTLLDGVFLIQPDSRLTLLNPPDQPLLRDLSEIEKGIFYQQLGDRQPGLLKQLKGGDPRWIEEFELNAPGCIVFRLAAFPLHDETGEFIGALLLINNISNEKARTKKDQLQDRLSTMSVFLDGITHELNNPLAAVSGYLQMLAMRYGGNPAIAEIAGKMTAELNRAIVILKNLIALADRKPLAKVPVQIGRLLQRTIDEEKKDPDLASVSIELAVQPDLPVVYVELENIRQMFRNLIRSAAHKLLVGKGSGSIHIEVRENGGRVQIVFSRALPCFLLNELTSSAFQPEFFDQPDKETADAVSFCPLVVKSHDGHIFCEMSPAGQQIFAVELPAFSDAISLAAFNSPSA